MINPYVNRKYVIISLIIFTFIVFVARLFYMQIIDDSYKYSAQNNSQRRITKYPARGVIFDRYGKILVYNEPAYDLMVIPIQTKEFDTTDLCNILEIEPELLRLILKRARLYSKYKPSVVIPQLSLETTAILKEKLYKFSGFFSAVANIAKISQTSSSPLIRIRRRSG